MQTTLVVFTVNVNSVEVGSVMITLPKSKHPEASVTITLYVPAPNPVAVAFVCAPGSSQRYVYGVIPPVAVAVAVPSKQPKQVAFVPEVVTIAPLRSATVADTVFVHPLASVTVHVQVPAGKELAVAVVCDPGSFQL